MLSSSETTADPSAVIDNQEPTRAATPVSKALPCEKTDFSLIMVVCYMLFFGTLNTTMFNVAIPDISRQFHLSPPRVSWVLTMYIALFGMGSVVYGKLADAYPLKNLLNVGMALFNIGAVCGLVAQSFPVLVLARILQATGGASLPALAMLVGIRYTHPSRRGRIMATVSSTIACGGAFGPIIGGLIAGNVHWRYLFLVSMLTLPAIPFYCRLLPVEESRKEPFDLIGAVLLGGLVLSLLVLVVQSRWLALPLCILFLAAFIARIRSTAFPFIRPQMLRDRLYRNGLFTLFLAQGTPIYGMMFTLPLLLRNINHLGTQAIGFAIFPGAMTAAVLSFFGGKVSDRKGSVTVVRVGFCFLLVGYTLLSILPGMKPHFITFGLIISYSGFSIVQSSLAKTVSMVLPPDQAGVGMGMYNLTFFISGSMGAAIASRIIEISAGSRPLNPLALPAAAGYSNVFILLIAMVICAAIIFVRTFKPADFLPAQAPANSSSRS